MIEKSNLIFVISLFTVETFQLAVVGCDHSWFRHYMVLVPLAICQLLGGEFTPRQLRQPFILCFTLLCKLYQKRGVFHPSKVAVFVGDSVPSPEIFDGRLRHGTNEYL